MGEGWVAGLDGEDGGAMRRMDGMTEDGGPLGKSDIRWRKLGKIQECVMITVVKRWHSY